MWMVLFPRYLCDSTLLLIAKAVMSPDHIASCCSFGVKGLLFNSVDISNFLSPVAKAQWNWKFCCVCCTI